MKINKKYDNCGFCIGACWFYFVQFFLFSRCRTDFLFLYIAVKALYFFSMAYKFKKGLESNYIHAIQLVNY